MASTKPPSGIVSTRKIGTEIEYSNESKSIFKSSSPGMRRRKDFKTLENPDSVHVTASSELAPDSDREVSDSHRVCDIIYGKWLEKKDNERRNSVKAVLELKKAEEKSLTEKQTIREERCRLAVRKWTAHKDSILRHKRNQLKSKEEVNSQQEEQLKEKRAESDVVCRAWLEKKKKISKKLHQQTVIAEKTEIERKEEESTERRLSSQKAFEAWAKHKESTLTSKKKKLNAQNLVVQDENTKQEEIKKAEAVAAFESWKVKKDSQIKLNGGLYTYNPDPRRPPKLSKWCPARSMKYVYPVDEQTEVKKGKNSLALKKNALLEETYSVESFDSDKESMNECDILSSSSNLSDHGLTNTGKIKSVQVCCKTIEYVCHCKT